jgi:hypothetical protein
VAELYISVDAETSGPIIGVHSMYSVGLVAYTKYGQEIGCFSVNLDELPGGQTYPVTAIFWAEHPAAFAAHRLNTVPPAQGMKALKQWLTDLADNGKNTLIFVAWPAPFDWGFLDWYLKVFADGNPFDGAIDMRSYIMGMFHRSYAASGKGALPPQLLGNYPNNLPHVALDDARHQGNLFMRLFLANSLTRG